MSCWRTPLKGKAGKLLSKLCSLSTNFEEHARHSYTRQDVCQQPPPENIQTWEGLKDHIVMSWPFCSVWSPQPSACSMCRTNRSAWLLQDKMWSARREKKCWMKTTLETSQKIPLRRIKKAKTYRLCAYTYLIPYLKSLPQMFKHFTGSTPASETTRLGVSAQSHS